MAKIDFSKSMDSFSETIPEAGLHKRILDRSFMEIFAQKFDNNKRLTLDAMCSVRRNMMYDPNESADKIPVEEKAEIVFVIDTKYIGRSDEKIFSKLKGAILKALKDIPVEYKYNIVTLGGKAVSEMWDETQFATEDNYKLADEWVKNIQIIQPDRGSKKGPGRPGNEDKGFELNHIYSHFLNMCAVYKLVIRVTC